MYDSDEVRDAVRREMWQRILTPGGPAPLPAEERAALDEARRAEAEAALRQWAAAVWEQLRESFARFAESIAEIGEAALELLKRALEPAAEALRELAERIGILREREEAPPPWKRQSRKPEIQPVRYVDAVAAGRHPATIQRTRIRGGRR